MEHLIKASLGVLTATLLSATTLPVDLVADLQSLRMPTSVVAIQVSSATSMGRRPVHAHAGRAAARHALNLTAVVAGHRVGPWQRCSSGRTNAANGSILALVSRGYDKLPAPPPVARIPGRSPRCFQIPPPSFRDRSDDAMGDRTARRGLHVSPTAPALRDVSLSIARDEQVAARLNGAGKTTWPCISTVFWRPRKERCASRVGAWSAPRCAIRADRSDGLQDPTINCSCPRWPRMSPSGPTNFEAARRSRSGAACAGRRRDGSGGTTRSSSPVLRAAAAWRSPRF